MIGMDTKVKVPEGVYFQKVSGEAVILDTETGKYFGLDPVGTRMWALLSELGSLGMAANALLEEYEVSAEKLQADLVRLVEQLTEKGLLVVEE